jgi:hypothetical protein
MIWCFYHKAETVSFCVEWSKRRKRDWDRETGRQTDDGLPEYEVEQRTSRNLFLCELMSQSSLPPSLILILICFFSWKSRVAFYVDNKKLEVTFDNCIPSYVLRLFILLNLCIYPRASHEGIKQWFLILFHLRNPWQPTSINCTFYISQNKITKRGNEGFLEVKWLSKPAPPLVITSN